MLATLCRRLLELDAELETFPEWPTADEVRRERTVCREINEGLAAMAATPCVTLADLQDKARVLQTCEAGDEISGSNGLASSLLRDIIALKTLSCVQAEASPGAAH